jgi:hypothetical protein
MCFPHPEDYNANMRMMIFSNPALLGLLHGIVDIFVDATFSPCTPHLFLQCLIVMVFNNHMSSFVPVIYALMTHKYASLYYQVFMQLKIITKNKMQVHTYTSNFERAEMNMLAVHCWEGTHLGCFFHLKKAWFKYLMENCGLGHQSVSLEPVMKVGGLDILCVLPRCKVL